MECRKIFTELIGNTRQMITMFNNANEKLEAERNKYQKCKNAVGKSHLWYEETELDWKKAQEEYRNEIEDLKKWSYDARKEYEDRVAEQVKKDYAVKSESVNMTDLELVKSGILTVEECAALLDKHSGNVTMLKLIDRMCKGKDGWLTEKSKRNIGNLEGEAEKDLMKNLAMICEQNFGGMSKHAIPRFEDKARAIMEAYDNLTIRKKNKAKESTENE